MTGTLPIEIQKGGGWDRTLPFTKAGLVYPLTDVDTVVMTITPSDGGTPIVLSNGNGKVIINGAAGTLEFKLTKTEVAAFTWSNGTHVTLIAFTSAYTDAIKLTGPVTITP